jgi:hypothetical protein
VSSGGMLRGREEVPCLWRGQSLPSCVQRANVGCEPTVAASDDAPRNDRSAVAVRLMRAPQLGAAKRKQRAARQ